MLCGRRHVVGTGSLDINIRSERGVVTVCLLEVGHVSGLSDHLMSLQLIADAGNCCTGNSEDITTKFFKSGDELLPSSVGQLNSFNGFQDISAKRASAYGSCPGGHTNSPSR